jgi:head-tail adaptor
MLKFGSMTTPIRIKKRTVSKAEGKPKETWIDILAEDIACEWKNKHGSKVYEAAAINAKEPAAIRLWYISGITPDCRVVRLEDEAVFEIVNIDDIGNRHQQLEIELKRYVNG